MPHGGIIVLVALLILFSMYRRVKRTIGFQKFNRGRMITRMGLFAVVGIVFLAVGYLNPTVYIFDAAGIILGVVVAYFAVRTTAFEWRKDAWYYRPNPWIGVLLIVLFVGRIAYRIYQDYALFAKAAQAHGQLQQQNQFASYSHDPSTTIILFTLITYYFVYYTFLMRTERHLEAETKQPE